MMELSNYYSTPFRDVEEIDVFTLSRMYSGMISNKARDRLHRIEEISSVHWKEKDRVKFINTIYKQIDDKYKNPKQVDESELKRILGNGGR